jgi:hypothetical protein
MKNTLPAVLFIIGLVGLTGISTAKADVVEDHVERFSAYCVSYDRYVVNEDSVKDIIREADGYITMTTEDNRKIITGGVCTFKQLKPNKKVTMIENKEFPEDGEQRYAIGH